jgi:hypothetical protein
MAEKAKEKDSPDGVTMDVRVKGTPEQVSEGLSGLNRDLPNPPEPEDSKSVIKKALKDPINEVRCTRYHPETFGQYKLKNFVDIPCPATRMEIEEYLRENYGGERWKVEVVNPDGEQEAGFKIRINEIPKPVFERRASQGNYLDLGGDGDPFGGGRRRRGGETDELAKLREELEKEEDDDDEEKEEDIEKFLARMQKRKLLMAEIEGLRDNNKKGESEVATLITRLESNFQAQISAIQESNKEQLAELRRQQEADKHARELKEAREEAERKLENTRREYQMQLEELKRDITGTKAAPQDMVKEVVKALRGDDSKTWEMFQAMSSMSQENFKQVVAMLSNQRPESTLDTVSSVMGAFADMGSMMGWGKGGSDDSDMPFESRVVKAISDVTPEVLGFLKEERAKGRELTAELIDKKIEDSVSKVADVVKGEVRSAVGDQAKRLLAAGAIPGPAGQPAAPNQPGPQTEQTQTPETKISDDDLSKLFDTENDVPTLVNQALILAGRDMKLKPGRAKWVDFVFENFPESMVKALAEAKTPQEFFGVLQPHADEKILKAVLNMILTDQPARDWLKHHVEEFRRAFYEDEGEEDSPYAEYTSDAPDDAGVDEAAIEFNVDEPLPSGGMETPPPTTTETPPPTETTTPPPTETTTPPAPDTLAGPLGNLPQSNPDAAPPVDPGPLGNLAQAPTEEEPPKAKTEEKEEEKTDGGA